MLHNAKIEEVLKGFEEGVEKDLTAGQHNVINAYYSTQRKKHDTLIINEIIWEQDYQDTLNALREYGITEIAFTSTWSSAINFPHFLLSNGCQVTGPTEVIEKGYFHDEVQKGLLIKIR